MHNVNQRTRQNATCSSTLKVQRAACNLLREFSLAQAISPILHTGAALLAWYEAV